MTAIVIDHPRRAFFCWRHHRHYPWKKLNYCFCRGCNRMVLPVNLKWRTPALGLAVPLASMRVV